VLDLTDVCGTSKLKMLWATHGRRRPWYIARVGSALQIVSTALQHSREFLKLLYSPFDNNRLSVSGYLHEQGSDVTRLLCRWQDPYSNPLYSSFGVHELCIIRKGSSLQFRRWSNDRAHSTLWMALFFKTFESWLSSQNMQHFWLAR
jgi:hypothetical protein